MTDNDGSELQPDAHEVKEVPQNPDLSDDLGYELIDLDVITVDNPNEKVLVMPKDEEMLHDNMFMVVGPDSIVDLIDEV